MRNKTIAVGLAALLSISGCSTVTIHPTTSNNKLVTSPSFEKSEDFFFWGLKGEHRIDVQEVCKNKIVKQMQSQQTFTDGLETVITLGIYAPHSVKIWCE